MALLLKNKIDLYYCEDGGIISALQPKREYKMLWAGMKWVLLREKDGCSRLINNKGISIDFNKNTFDWFEVIK